MLLEALGTLTGRLLGNTQHESSLSPAPVRSPVKVLQSHPRTRRASLLRWRGINEPGGSLARHEDKSRNAPHVLRSLCSDFLSDRRFHFTKKSPFPFFSPHGCSFAHLLSSFFPRCAAVDQMQKRHSRQNSAVRSRSSTRTDPAYFQIHC